MDSRKKNILIALMVAMFLGAVEGTVVTTAIPTIAKALNGFEIISWVFSLYLLTSAISTPIFGKLADLYGRKNMLSLGILIFILGSFLCGFSETMLELIFFRAIQGIGAGAIFTITYTIVGDIFSVSEMAKVQGWLGTVWGVASLAGPLVGGILIEYFSWKWIFFINIPFGILCIILLQRNLNENLEKKEISIDFIGIMVLSSAIITILIGSLVSGKDSNGYFISFIKYIIVTIVLLIVFYFVEKKSKEPVIHFDIFSKSGTIVNLISFFASAILIAINVYMPIYFQNILGLNPTISGLVLAPMSISWLLSSVILAKAIPKYGERIIMEISTLILLISSIFLYTMGIKTNINLAMLYTFIMGFGFGSSFTILTILVQVSVDFKKRGTATAVNSLIRTLGQTIGIGIFGSLFNLYIVRYFYSIGIKGVLPDSLYSKSGINSAFTIGQIKGSLNASLHIIFMILIIVSIICFCLSLTVSNDLKEQNNACN